MIITIIHQNNNYNKNNYNIVIHHIWAILQSDWLRYSQYITSYTVGSKNEMAEKTKLKSFANRKTAKYSL